MTTPKSAALPITAELVLEVFDAPITFHRCLVTITGSVSAALMLSQAITWTEDLEPHAHSWFTKSTAEWTEQTGLSRWEQETARKILRDLELLDERISGVPARLWFRVNRRALGTALSEAAQHRAASLN